MPCTPEAVQTFLGAKIPFGPGKASNAGGVATSGLEMAQNSQRLAWTFDEVDAKLKGIMIGIHAAAKNAAAQYGTPGNLVNGANIAGFEKVARAMMAHGV
jgi:glutamate dehydrogenase (NADP+)